MATNVRLAIWTQYQSTNFCHPLRSHHLPPSSVSKLHSTANQQLKAVSRLISPDFQLLFVQPLQVFIYPILSPVWRVSGFCLPMERTRIERFRAIFRPLCAIILCYLLTYLEHHSTVPLTRLNQTNLVYQFTRLPPLFHFSCFLSNNLRILTMANVMCN